MRNGSLRKETVKMNDVLNVKVGDEVLYVSSSYSRIEKIAIVTKITPTGRIRIDKSKKQFDKYGWQMGNTGWRARDYICILTSEKKEEILRKSKIAECIRLFDVSKNKLTYDQAKSIVSILLGENKNG